MTPPDCCTSACAGNPCGDCPGNEDAAPPAPVFRSHITVAECACVRNGKADPSCDLGCSGSGRVEVED